MHLTTSAFVSLILATAASAQLPDVAIVASAATNTNDCEYTDPQAKLMATGMFNLVGVINAGLANPSLQDLQQFDAVITWSNISYFDSAAFGDNLADYVDAGGGVVVAVFANSTTATNSTIRGRWLQGYEVIAPQSGTTQGTPETLGTLNQPGHPLLSGVTTFSGGQNSHRPTGTALTQGSASVAEWSDGRVLVATGAQPNRVDLGFYPPSSDCSAPLWDSSTDGGLLLANALTYVTGSNIGTNYCSPAVPNSTGQPGLLTAFGTSQILNGNLSLSANQLPNNQFGIFLNSLGQGFNPGPGGSQGTLCLSGAIGRYNGPGQILNSGMLGAFTLGLDLTLTPTPTGPTAIVMGETWHFQTWYRDLNPAPTSNFTDAVTITFN